MRLPGLPPFFINLVEKIQPLRFEVPPDFPHVGRTFRDTSISFTARLTENAPSSMFNSSPSQSPGDQIALKRTRKPAYGSADFSISLVITFVGVYFAIFLVNVVGMSAGGAAIAVFLGRSWDYVNDPLLGYLSDRTRSKWGRRRPFLLFGSVPLGVAFAMMWWLPPIAGGLLSGRDPEPLQRNVGRNGTWCNMNIKREYLGIPGLTRLINQNVVKG